MSKRQYVYHCTNVDPEIIKREGWKVGMGFTKGNFFDDLYKKYDPKVPVHITGSEREVWDTNAEYIIKLDITGLDLYPDFGSLPDTGAFYDLDERYFHWYDDSGIGLTFTNNDAGRKMKEYLESISPDEYILLPDDFTGEISMRILGTAVVDGSKLQGRIVSYTKKDDKMKINENSKITLTVEQLKRLIKEGRFLNKVKGLDVEDNKLRGQILEDLKTIVDAEEDLSDAQSILNEMPKVDGISWELGENSGPGILYDSAVSQYLDLYGASIEISEGEFDIYYQFKGVPGFGFGTVHFPGIVSFADAIMESKIVEYKALTFTDEDKEIIADAIHQMAMGIPAMLNKVEQLYKNKNKNKNMKLDESTKVTLTLKQLKRLVKESSGDRLQELLDKPTTFDGKTDKHPIIGKVYYSKENKFAWKLVWNKARNEDRIHVFKPSIISVAGDKRFGWREYLISADLETMKEIGFKEFDSKEEAQKEFNNLVKEASEPDTAEPQGQYLKCRKKEYSIEVYVPEPGTKVHNKLENSDYVTDEKKPFVLVGTVGEEWTVDAKKLTKTYTLDGKDIDEEAIQEASDGKKHTITTKADAGINWCKFIPKNIKCKVDTSWGETLEVNRSGVPHGEGDYIVTADKGGEPDLDDRWVVNGEIFQRTYEILDKGEPLNENTKFTLTIGQLRRLVKEATALNEAPDQEPIDRMEGDILRLGPCNHQKTLCWNLQGFCFTPVKVNPSFSKRMPYMMVCKQGDTWQLHFENFAKFDSKPYLDALYKAFAKTCEEQGIKEINAVGGCTPGGISGISALERYGFHKEYLPTPKTLKAGEDGDKTNIYWGGDTIDPAKVEKWLNGGKHLQEFLVVGNPEKRHEHPEECPLSEPTGEEKYTLDNTNPRPFMMVR